MKFPRPCLTALCCLLLLAVGRPAWASGPLASCQTELQHLSSGGAAEDALRACTPLFQQSGCQNAWRELLDTPREGPGYGRGASLARLAEACRKAYCGLPGLGHPALCAGPAPPPLTAEFFGAWRTFQTEVLRRERVPGATSERLATALQRWVGFQPRPGTRHVLQAVARPDVPGVVGLTLWSARGERLGAWVTEVDVDEGTLQAVQAAVPAPSGPAAGPCVRLEVSPGVLRVTTEALLHAVRAVCPVDLVTVHDA